VVPGNDPDALLGKLMETGEVWEAGGEPLSPPPGQTSAPALFPYEEVGNLTRTNIKVQEGCAGGCTYCIVPRARGRPTSRAPGEVLAAIDAAARAGFREIVLTGTHLARYGLESPGGEGLLALMARIEDLAPPCRIRLSSLEPDELLGSVIEVMARSRLWCRHLHIPLQHGCDDLLTAMGRGYRMATINSHLEAAAAAMPGLGLGLDIIVGFPGETEVRFEELCRHLESIPFTYLHVFSFSPRPGTAAADLPGRVPHQETRARSRRLRQLAGDRQSAFAESLAGQRADVLIEHRRAPDSGLLMGLTDNYVRLTVKGPDSWMGRVIQCRLELDGGGIMRGWADHVRG